MNARPVIVKMLFLLMASCASLSAEAMLQYFGTTWNEIERRIPELAERGYDSLWLPPPFKAGAGTYSVGFDTFDRFDLGDRDGSGTVSTKYGTKADLQRLMKTAHRFGLRVYFDNVMAHNAGPLDKNTDPGEIFPGIPGFVPEDFHLVREVDGTWRKAADWPNWQDEWQVLNRNPFAWDIANEHPQNVSFNPNGTAEANTYPKWVGIRHPGQHAWYLDTDLTVGTNQAGDPVHPFANKEPYQDIGYGASFTGANNGRFDWNDANSNGQHDLGEMSETFTDTGVDPSATWRQTAPWGHGDGIYNMGNIVAEDVNGMLYRAVRWFINETSADGFRLDAVKHVPSGFFGKQTGGDKDSVNWGYNGQIQEQFNITRGFSDWGNHRDSNYNAEYQARDDAFLFGEHLGSPPFESGYLDAGMRIANDNLLNTVKNGMGSNLTGFDQPNYGAYGTAQTGMNYVMSHDNNYLFGGDRRLAHTYILTREGSPIIYTDGYNQAGAPDYFPKPSGVNFLGQFNDNSVISALAVHRDFARGYQIARWSDQNFCAYERIDDREKKSGSWNGQTMLFMMARNYQPNGQARPVQTGFPVGATLVNQSPHGGRFFAYVNPSGVVVDGSGNPPVVPANGWFCFTWHNPQLPTVWQGAEHQLEKPPIEIYQDGSKAPMMDHWRTDGKDGDPSFNPFGVPATATAEKSYRVKIPRVTNGSNLRILARSDGSAENIRIKLNGGVNVNSQMTPALGPQTGDLRDFPPGMNDDRFAPADSVRQSSIDSYAGYEQMKFLGRTSEKFAARDIARNVIGTPGAETYQTTIGSAGFVINNGGGINDGSNRHSEWVYHDPSGNNQAADPVLQMNPAPQNAAGQSFDLWVKIGYQFQWDKIYLYYTTDGLTYPEGNAGVGKGSTQVIEGAWAFNGATDGVGNPDWGKITLPALPSGTVFRYKIGVRRTHTATSVYPFGVNDIALAERMETQFEINNFNAMTAQFFVHNDYGAQQTGLEEGFHVIRTRNFVNRNNGASIFKTNTQVFYYDTAKPTGILRYPSENDTIGGSSYDAVVLTDPSVTEVWFSIEDLDPSNDNVATGNGLNQWKQATQEASPSNLGTSVFQKEWRFVYANIPSFGTANIRVRLKEASSSANNSLSDVDGWFTTLTRQVNTGSSINFNIGVPSTTGEMVDRNFIMRTYFKKELIPSGMTDADFIQEMSVYISSSVSGSTENPILQNRGLYLLERDVNATEHSVALMFPNLYNGNPDFLHTVRAVHQRGTLTLSDSVMVRMRLDETSDSDGDELPDFWENMHLLDAQNGTGRHGPAGDDDGDGYSNSDEFLAGMNPLSADPENFPQLRIEPNVGWPGTWKLKFPSIPNRRYRMKYSFDLQNWQTWTGDMVTTGQVYNPENTWIDDGWSTYPHPSTQAKRFYQLHILKP